MMKRALTDRYLLPPVLALALAIPAAPAVAIGPRTTWAEAREAAQLLPELVASAPAGPLRDYLEQVAQSGPEHSATAANAVRVARDMESAAAERRVLLHYAVPAMSVLQRLPDAYPIDGTANGEVRILAARDEYEPGSFVLFAFRDIDSVVLNVSELRSAEGRTFPAAELDLTVIKVWYQNGNGWYSYFADPGLKLTPELLLHDETLIEVDREKKANFARVDYPEGSEYRWISAPRYMEDSGATDNDFKALTLPFADADTIRPVTLKAGEFKQFFITARVGKDCPEGLYRGKIGLEAGGESIGEIPVALRVLPIALPAPKTYFDRDRDFVVALMGQTFFEKQAGGDTERARRIRLALLENQRRHNVLHSRVRPDDPAAIEDLKTAGMSTDVVLSNPGVTWYGMHWGGRYNYDQLMDGRRSAESDAQHYMAHIGHTRVILKYADEPGANFVAMARNLFPAYLNYDFMVGTAGHAQIFNKAGYMWRAIASGCFPEADETGKSPEAFNEMRADGYTGFYAGQHNGVENPQYVRRQHGMLSYLNNWSMIDNYEFGYATWSDPSTGLYKPMNLAYPTSKGPVDTLAWEGFREGIDDMRYATRLMQLADEAEAGDDLAFKLAGRKARQYLALVDPEEADLDELRYAMIDKILALQKLAGE